MTTTQITGLTWKRGVEDRYPGTMDATLSWGSYDKETDGPFLSGMVVGLTNGNEVVKAAATPFRGIMFTEVSDEIDESLGGAPPTVIVGGATLFIRRRALSPTASYAKGQYLTSGTGADAGRLVPEGATPNLEHRVGYVQDVYTDGILMRLFPPTV